MEFDFELPREEYRLVVLIVDRFVRLCEANCVYGEGVMSRQEVQQARRDDRLSREMDLIVTHKYACPLDFEKLLRFDDFSLIHDVLGIRNCLNRITGQLENHFLPRCAVPQARA